MKEELGAEGGGLSRGAIFGRGAGGGINGRAAPRIAAAIRPPTLHAPQTRADTAPSRALTSVRCPATGAGAAP